MQIAAFFVSMISMPAAVGQADIGGGRGEISGEGNARRTVNAKPRLEFD